MAYKHTQEQALDTATITIRPKLELKYKILVMTKYKTTVAKAILAICEEAVRGVKLTKREVDLIQADMKAAYEKRMVNRIKVAAYNRGLKDGNFRKGK